jgi:predicted ester cyclase
MSTEEDNKIIVQRFYDEVMSKGIVNVLDEIMDENFVDHGEALFGSPQGRKTLKQGIAETHEILPDLNVHLEGIIAEADLVGVRGTMRCTHRGTFLGVPGTGHELSWRGIALFRIANSKIVERWFNSDSVSIVRQLGLASAVIAGGR